MTGCAFPAATVGPLASWQDGLDVGSWPIRRKASPPGRLSIRTAPPHCKRRGPRPRLARASSAVINGVFALTNSPNAVLHALDGASGKSSWTSGKTMTAATRIGSGFRKFTQVYIGTGDGTLYAFGFPIEH